MDRRRRPGVHHPLRPFPARHRPAHAGDGLGAGASGGGEHRQLPALPAQPRRIQPRTVRPIAARRDGAQRPALSQRRGAQSVHLPVPATGHHRRGASGRVIRLGARGGRHRVLRRAFDILPADRDSPRWRTRHRKPARAGAVHLLPAGRRSPDLSDHPHQRQPRGPRCPRRGAEAAGGGRGPYRADRTAGLRCRPRARHPAGDAVGHHERLAPGRRFFLRPGAAGRAGRGGGPAGQVQDHRIQHPDLGWTDARRRHRADYRADLLRRSDRRLEPRGDGKTAHLFQRLRPGPADGCRPCVAPGGLQPARQRARSVAPRHNGHPVTRRGRCAGNRFGRWARLLARGFGIARPSLCFHQGTARRRPRAVPRQQCRAQAGRNARSTQRRRWRRYDRGAAPAVGIHRERAVDVSKGSLLIVEDDMALAKALKRSFERREYQVAHVADYDAMEQFLAGASPDFAVVDLKLVGRSGLDCVKRLHAHDPDMRIVVLTGFASIATAVEAVKLGASHYLPKPANTDDIELAFDRDEGDASIAVDGRPTSLKNLEWERIHQTLVEADFNISETARRLGMHRRTLARKLEKRQVR
ncbi:response regulator transcription factor [Aureimonas sp. OT7]|nr:response regulator transcription factor [Aureimonas sp. OT7]